MTTLTMNGKTIDPKAIDHTEDRIISDNIEDTMDLLGRYIDGLSSAYEGLCELLSDAGMDTKNAIFTTTDSYGRVLTISGLNALKGANSILFTDTDKPTAESIYKAMLQFHDGEGSEIEDSNEFYYGMAEAIVRTLKGKNVEFVNDLSDKIWEAMIQFNGGEDDFLVDNNLHEMAIAIAQSLNKSTVEAVYTAMLQFHKCEGSEIEDQNEFYYGMAKAIVDSMSKQ